MSLVYYTNRWHIEYRPDGRYGRKVHFPVPLAIQDRDAAQDYHDYFIQEWKAAKGDSPEPKSLTGLTIGQLWDEYVKWSELHHAKTTHKDIVNIGKFIRKYIGQYNAEVIGPHHCGIYQRLRTADADRPIPRAINKELAYLGGMVRWAGRQGHITPRVLQRDRLPYKRPIPRILTVGEVTSIIKAAEPFYQAYFLCLYALGLRSVEARNLQKGL